MEMLALEKADKLLRKETQSRRKLRQIQVREQSNEWMERNRKKYLQEKERQIQLITESLTLEAQNNAVKEIEKMERMHDLCSAQVGEAHRAAAELPNFEILNSQKNQENFEKAKDRGAQALAQEKLAAETAFKAAKQARILREHIRQEEDYRFKEFVSKSVFTTKSHAAVDRIVDKLTNTRTEARRRPEYQPSLAKTLRVPKVSHSDEKLSKTKKHARLSRKSKDVAYYDSSVPQNSLKYPQPPGLVQKYIKEKHALNAFEAAQRISAHQEKLDSKKKLEDSKKAKEADVRGKSALKVAKLQRQLDQITNELEADGFVVDSKLNDSFLGLSDSENGDSSDTRKVQGVPPKSPTIPQKGSPAKKVLKKQDQDTSFTSYKKPTSADKGSKQNDIFLGISDSENGDSSVARNVVQHVPPKSPTIPQKVSSFKKVLKKQDQDTSFTFSKKPTSADQDVKRKTQSLSSGKFPVSPLTKYTEKYPNKPTPQQKPSPATGTTPPKKAAMSDSVDAGQSSTTPASSPAKKAQKNGERHPDLSSSLTKPDQKHNGESSLNELEKPKLISTRKSVRQHQQQQAIDISGSRGAPLEGEKNVGVSKKPTLDKKAGETKDDSKKSSPAKSMTKPKLSSRKTDKDSSSSVHTLSSASPENASDQPVTDYFSPPDHSKSFPLTSTPAEEGANGKALKDQLQQQSAQRDQSTSAGTTSRNTTATDGTISPQTAAKRKQALHYYIKKLLQMRPESMCNLHASSSTSVSSYVEIPTSAVSSLVSSDPPSANSSGISIPSGLASWRTACPENGKSTTNPDNDVSVTPTNTTHSSPSYNTGTGTTLSSVTEVDEVDEIVRVNRVDDESDTVNQVSSAETIAKVTFKVHS